MAKPILFLSNSSSIRDMHDAGFSAKMAAGVAAIAVLVIGACSVTSVRRIALRFSATQKPRYQPIYEDEDGTSTLESEASYSYQIARVVVLLLSGICLSSSLVLGVVTVQSLSSSLRAEQWLHCGAWVFYDLPNERALGANLDIRSSSSFRQWHCSSSHST